MRKKNLGQMHEQHQLAKSRVKKNEELTSLMRQAVECLGEKKAIQIDELPHEYHVQRAKIAARGVGICSSCRFQSGCLRCDEAKCLAYWMRREHKRAGRPIDAKYQMGQP